MSNSREDSPDWLREFQAPSAVLTLSSDSEASLKKSPMRDDIADLKTDSSLDESQLVMSDEEWEEKASSKLSTKSESKPVNKKTPRKCQKVEGTPAKRKKTGKEDATKSEGLFKKQTENHEKEAVWSLSSDSESDAFLNKTDQPSAFKLEEKKMHNDADLLDDKESVPEIALKGKSPKKKNADHTSTAKKELKDEMETEGGCADVPEVEKTSEKHAQQRASSTMLPLVLPEKVQRSKALVECEGDCIDLSGDVGAVGRVIISGDPPADREMLLDLKGTIYRTTIVPSRTFCVVSVGPSEAKIEAIMNDFIQLKPQSNVYDAETMVEGTLEGFYFGSDDEAEKMPKADQNEGDEEQTNEKTKAKSGKKSAGVQNKGKASGGKAGALKKGKAAGGGKQVKKKKAPVKKGKAKK